MNENMRRTIAFENFQPKSCCRNRHELKWYWVTCTHLHTSGEMQAICTCNLSTQIFSLLFYSQNLAKFSSQKRVSSYTSSDAGTYGQKVKTTSKWKWKFCSFAKIICVNRKFSCSKCFVKYFCTKFCWSLKMISFQMLQLKVNFNLIRKSSGDRKVQSGLMKTKNAVDIKSHAYYFIKATANLTSSLTSRKYLQNSALRYDFWAKVRKSTNIRL